MYLNSIGNNIVYNNRIDNILIQTHNDEGETSPTKDTSTLRRKLFFMNDNDDPISPVKM